MEGYCPFLETEPRRQGASRYCCAVGVNFYSVGEARELCRTCPIAHLGDALLCEHLDVYAFLRVNREGKQSVQVEMECRLGAAQVPDSARCDICPAMQNVGSEGIPGTVSLGDVQWSKE
jgi:hypothetical protein